MNTPPIKPALKEPNLLNVSHFGRECATPEGIGRIVTLNKESVFVRLYASTALVPFKPEDVKLVKLELE